MDHPLISITVCMRDAEEWIDDCIESLVLQTYRPLEIIAVDDGSADSGLSILERWSGEHNGIPVRVFSQKPMGLSAGRNLAVEKSKGEWVAITDIDCRPDPYWISEMFSVSDGLGDEEVWAVTGRTIFEKGETKISKLRSDSIARKYSGRPRLASLANGPCSMFKRVALDQVGGFNPEWYHAEDMEVSLQIIQAGGVIIHTPDAIVNHIAESSKSVFLRKRSRDARAHVRIRRKFGKHGVRKPNGVIHLHDFVSDAERVVWLFPIALLGLSFSMFSLLTFQSPIRNGVILVSIIWVFLIVKRGNEFLWSIALWHGAILGLSDIILGRNGHRKLVKREDQS